MRPRMSGTSCKKKKACVCVLDEKGGGKLGGGLAGPIMTDDFEEYKKLGNTPKFCLQDRRAVKRGTCGVFSCDNNINASHPSFPHLSLLSLALRLVDLALFLQQEHSRFNRLKARFLASGGHFNLLHWSFFFLSFFFFLSPPPSFVL